LLPETPLERAAFRWCLFVYLLAVLAFLGWFRWAHGAAQLLALGGLALTSFLAMGKLVIFAGLSPDSPSIWTLAALVFGIDMACAFLLASGIGPLERIPRLGRGLARANARAERALRAYPGLRRLAFLGVVAFVLIPVAGTGAITGSFVARLLGLKRLTGVAAIGFASALSATCFALLARFVGEGAEHLLRNPVLITLGALGAAGVLWLAYRRVLRALRTAPLEVPAGPGP